MNITITTDPNYTGNDPTAELAKAVADLLATGVEYIAQDIQATRITIECGLPDYGPTSPAEKVGTIVVDFTEGTD